MFFLYSVKNVIRSWGKSVIFLLLIFLLVFVLCVEVGLYTAINDLLLQCKESYTTIARLEYMGADYPNESKYDPGISRSFELIDFSAIETNPAAKVWDQSAVALGYVDGITGKNPLAPYKERAVLLVWITGFKEDESVNYGMIIKSLYAFDDVDGKMIYIDTDGKQLDSGHYYLVHGEFFSGQTSYTYFRVSNYENACAEQNGYELSSKSMIADITSADGRYSIPEDIYFHAIADTYAVVNQSVTVNATYDVESLYPFHQEMLYLTEGRYFTQEEYALGSKVCIISQELAKRLNVKIGDSVRLSVARQGNCSRNESYWAQSGFTYSDDYTVVGLTNTYKELANDIFIPKSDSVDLSPNRFSFTLGQAKIDSDMADQFISDILPLLPDRVRLTVYDQGYSGIARPLGDILHFTRIALLVSFAAGIAIISLFGFIFVYKQRDTAVTMRKLGTGKGDVYLYFLFGSGIICLFAVTLGITACSLVSDRIFDLVEKIVRSSGAANLLYSNGNLSISKETDIKLSVKVITYLMTGAVVFALSVLSCRIFAALSIKNRVHKPKAFMAKRESRSSSLRGGPLKYAWLSVKRGGFRSAIPFFASTCAVLLLLQLSYTFELNVRNLDDFNTNTPVKGYFTDDRGRMVSKLSISGNSVNYLYLSGLTSEISVSKRGSYYYIGPSNDEKTLDSVNRILHPRTSFAQETFYNKLRLGPGIIYTNNLLASPEFYYSRSITTNFLNGYDLSFLGKEPAGEGIDCMVSTSFLEENKLNLGDVVKVAVYVLSDDINMFWFQDLHIVGSYVKAGAEDNIYCQLAAYIPPSLLGNAEATAEDFRFYSLSSASFTFESSNLVELKEYLKSKGFSEVNRPDRIRNYIVIEDKMFLTTQSTMNRRIWHMRITYPFIYLAVELLSCLLPYLLIQVRKREIAVMRSLGASKITSVLSMLIEQAMLCIAGVVVGNMVWHVFVKDSSTIGAILVIVFAFLWFAGTVFSVRQINNSSVKSILAAKE